MNTENHIYLDHASITPIDPEVETYHSELVRTLAGNPSAVHQAGRAAGQKLNEARELIARLTGVRSNEVIFTASGSEANNLALIGITEASDLPRPHIITSAIEHSSILAPVRHLEQQGVEVSYIAPDRRGLISPEAIKAAIKPETVLVSVMLVNNELGTIQPIRDIARVIKEFNRDRAQPIHLHTDACQAPNHLSINLESYGAQLMTLDSLKFYGPRGVGVLIRKRSVELKPIIHGGGQEFGLRSGTENVPAVAAAAWALKKSLELQESENNRLSALRGKLYSGLSQARPEIELNSSMEQTIPSVLSVCLTGLEAEFALTKLDQAGVMAASTSACRNLQGQVSSYVLEAIGKDHCSRSALRLSLGRWTTEEEIDRTVKIISRTLS